MPVIFVNQFTEVEKLSEFLSLYGASGPIINTSEIECIYLNVMINKMILIVLAEIYRDEKVLCR